MEISTYIIRTIRLIGSLLILAGLSSCNDDETPSAAGQGNVTSEVLMQSPEHFNATELSVSADGNYIAATINLGLNNSANVFEHYYSEDGGQTFSLNNNLAGHEMISDNGMVLIKNTLLNLVSSAFTNFTTNTNVDATLTPDGTVYFVEQDPENGYVLTLYKFENGTKTSTGITGERLTGRLIYTNGKIGIFSYYYNNLSVYDIAENILTDRSRPAIDANALSGPYSIVNYHKADYSEGYWVIASTQGAVVIAPDDQLTYYSYQSDYWYSGSPVDVRLVKDKLYLQLFNYTAFQLQQPTNFSFESENGVLVSSDKGWPLVQDTDALYYPGFIENGSKGLPNLVKETGSSKSYLTSPLHYGDYRNADLGYVGKVGDQVYYLDKVYDTGSGTYSTSDFKGIHYIYSEPGRDIVYADNGTFISANDGSTWSLVSDTGPALKFVIKNNQGGYYGMDYDTYRYNFGGTGFSTPAYDLYTYSSSDGISWQQIAVIKDQQGGYPPGGISPNGVIVVTRNTNPLGNPVYVTSLSTDAASSFTELPDDDPRTQQQKPGEYKTYYVINGRHIAFTNVTSSGRFEAISCMDIIGDCPPTEIESIVMDLIDEVPHYTAGGSAVLATNAIYEFKGL